MRRSQLILSGLALAAALGVAALLVLASPQPSATSTDTFKGLRFGAEYLAVLLSAFVVGRAAERSRRSDRRGWTVGLLLLFWALILAFGLRIAIAEWALETTPPTPLPLLDVVLYAVLPSVGVLAAGAYTLRHAPRAPLASPGIR